MPTTYYKLVAQGSVAPGATVSANDGDEPAVVTVDPRHLLPSAFLPVHPADVVLGPDAFQEPDSNAHPVCELARLRPLGRVEVLSVQDRGYPAGWDIIAHQFVCPDGWVVEALEPIDALLGPQAEHLLYAARRAESEIGDDTTDERFMSYDASVGALLATHAGEVSAYYAGIEAAIDALDKRGADSIWWDEWSTRVYGSALIALAARDLIGTTPEWTRPAYDVLTAPWRAEFGCPIHPADDRHLLTVPTPAGPGQLGDNTQELVVTLARPGAPAIPLRITIAQDEYGVAVGVYPGAPAKRTIVRWPTSGAGNPVVVNWRRPGIPRWLRQLTRIARPNRFSEDTK